MRTHVMDGKTFAKLEDLRLWPKNPRKVQDKDLGRLRTQIEQLGVYKPLVVTPDGEVLGGNQRFKVLCELFKEFPEKYEFIWVSEVEAWTDEERLKFALSDNDAVGSYTREALNEVLGDFIGQESLFADYNIEFSDRQSIDNFVKELSLPEAEFRFKQLKKGLKDLGITDETLGVIEQMALNNKTQEKLPEVDIKGCIEGLRHPILFWVDDLVTYEQLVEIFGTGKKDNHNTARLLEIIEAVGGEKLPTSLDKLEKIKKGLEKLEQEIFDRQDLGGSYEDLQAKKQLLINEFKRIYESVK